MLQGSAHHGPAVPVLSLLTKRGWREVPLLFKSSACLVPGTLCVGWVFGTRRMSDSLPVKLSPNGFSIYWWSGFFLTLKKRFLHSVLSISAWKGCICSQGFSYKLGWSIICLDLKSMRKTRSWGWRKRLTEMGLCMVDRFKERTPALPVYDRVEKC